MASTGATPNQDDRGIAMYEHLPAPPKTNTNIDPNSQDLAVVPRYDAGWYPDPNGGSGLRYYDGSDWTEHRHDPTPAVAASPTPAGPSGQQIVVNTYVAQSAGGAGGAQPKSAALAFVLTFIFGPFGMLYSTISGGLIMLVLDIILVPLTFGLILPILWPIQLVWAVVAANNANRAAGGNANAGPGAGGFANQVAN
jgi:hypothetical protein